MARLCRLSEVVKVVLLAQHLASAVTSFLLLLLLTSNNPEDKKRNTGLLVKLGQYRICVFNLEPSPLRFDVALNVSLVGCILFHIHNYLSGRFDQMTTGAAYTAVDGSSARFGGWRWIATDRRN